MLSRSVTSRASRSWTCSWARSAARRRAWTMGATLPSIVQPARAIQVALGACSGLPGDPAQRQRVPVDAETDDHPGCDRGQVAVLAERLARVHVADVHLHQRCGEL